NHEVKKREIIIKSNPFISKRPYNKPSGLNKSGNNQSTISLDDELIMLNSRLMQWCFLNAKAEHAFDFQKQTVETQLKDAWELLMKKQNEMSTLCRKFTLEKEIIELDITLKSQANLLLQINQHLEHFKTRYIAFVTALASTTTAMPIAYILTGEFKHLTEEINKCSNSLDETLQNWEKESSTIHNIANLIYKLYINIKEEIQELNECNSLLQKISEAEILETSLRIQKIEIISD
ncbi:9882_t:CDS:1, partial [Diversispora eburnea]